MRLATAAVALVAVADLPSPPAYVRGPVTWRPTKQFFYVTVDSQGTLHTYPEGEVWRPGVVHLGTVEVESEDRTVPLPVVLRPGTTVYYRIDGERYALQG